VIGAAGFTIERLFKGSLVLSNIKSVEYRIALFNISMQQTTKYWNCLLMLLSLAGSFWVTVSIHGTDAFLLWNLQILEM
jgi:hypothetical protein